MFAVICRDYVGTGPVKDRTIQNNLHLSYTIVDNAEDNEVAVINLYQFKAFDRVYRLYQVAVLQATEFQPDFCKSINPKNCSLSAVVQVNTNRSSAIALS